MKSLLRSRQLNPVYFAFMLVSFMVGIAGALQAPTLSLFLSREIAVRPFWVGLFFTVNAIAGIVISLLLARRSDSQGDRRNLILFCCLMAVAYTVLFAFNRSYLTLATVGILLSAIASVSMPQLFALAREYADSSAREVVMFSMVMRAMLSMAWVVGPPLSFALVLNYGFTVMYLVAAGLFVLCIALIWLALPSVPRTAATAATPAVEINLWRNRDVRLLFCASVLMWTSNTVYNIDMPLYISSVLGLPENLAGLLMGAAAGLEIPVMLLSAYYVKRIGKRRMMLLALTAGVLFYLGFSLLHSRNALMILQPLNAIFIGIVAGIGMIYFQDLLPGRAGAATTLFTNSISTGVILAGVIQGALAETLGHQAVYWVAMLLTLLALLLSGWVRDI